MGIVVHHIPVCPFSQRLEILLALKNRRDVVTFRVVDITRPRDPELLAKTRGTTALPVMELEDGSILKESLVLLRYLDECFAEPQIAATDPHRRAVERMLIATEGSFVGAGYRFVMNQDRSRRDDFENAMTAEWAKLDAFLRSHSPDGIFLYEAFGLAEAVFTPMFMRFWFLEHYEGYEIPATLGRARRWRDACLSHPAAQQVTREEIIKLYHDYALGVGNGALPPGRNVSSFSFEPHWSKRPLPPKGKYERAATDAELGLI